MRYFDSLAAAGYPISGGETYEQSWDSHIARGSRGGVDYGVGVGHAIYAPTRGRVRNWSTVGGGLTVNFYHLDANNQETGFYDQFMHLSSFGPEITFEPGQDIGARSGNTGTQTSGPHIHWNLVNPSGQRVKQWLYFTNDRKRGKDMIYVRNMQSGLNFGYCYLAAADYVHAVSSTEVQGLNAIFGMPIDFPIYNDLVRTLGALNIPADTVFNLKLGKTWSRVATIEGKLPK